MLVRSEIPATTGFVIGVTINSVEFENGASSTDDAMLTAKALDDAGFDFIELSGGAYEHLPAAGDNKEDSTLARETFFLKFLKDVSSKQSRNAPGPNRCGRTDPVAARTSWKRCRRA